MIYKGSRYSNSYTLEDDNGVVYLDIPKIEIKPKPNDMHYQFKADDRLDLLAKRFYGDSQKKWLILYANPQYSTEFDIEVGDVLNIPNKERDDIKWAFS